MDIDFTKPLTDEAKAYLKANLGKVEEWRLTQMSRFPARRWSS